MGNGRYVIGFCESLLDMLTGIYGDSFTGIVDRGMNDVRIIGSGTVALLLGIAIVGMSWITRHSSLYSTALV